MKNQEIIKKVIKKVVKNGWENKIAQWLWDNGKISLEEIVFDHKFAQAFWGNNKIEDLSLRTSTVQFWWQYHLQRMVISENPLDYLVNFKT